MVNTEIVHPMIISKNILARKLVISSNFNRACLTRKWFQGVMTYAGNDDWSPSF